MNTFPSVSVASKRDTTKKIGWDGLPIGTRKLAFHVDTGATFGSDKVPLVHGSLENPAEVVAIVTFEIDEDCSGESVDVTFYATAYVRVNDLVIRPVATKGTYEKDTGFITEQVLQKHKWTLPVTHIEGKPNIIRKGVYTSHIRLALDPALPSSCLPTKHVKAGIQYSFHARVSRTDPSSRRMVATVTANQNIWVLNNHSSSSVLPLQATEFAFKSSLPVHVSAPAQAVLGQSLPVTLAVGAFAQGSEHTAQPPVVLSAQFKLLETRQAQPTGNANLHHVQEVVNVPLPTDSASSPSSPRGGEGGWSRTVHVTVPSSPELTPSFKCALVSVEYSAAVVVKVKAENQKDRQAEEVKLTLPIKVVAPSPSAEQLPEYSRNLEDTVVVSKKGENEHGLPAYST
ncbi:hypothetical protein BGZ74_008243 [Mortierella antarctica]|nr:hypothetical protein BGZ74_008243 [Mortierella antarctica]